jgi:SulP family sulfate permease
LLPDADRILKARVTAIEVAQRLRLRGRTSLGATFLKVAAGYAERLAEVDGQFYLSGLDPSAAERLRPHRAAGGAGRHVRGHAARRRTEEARHAAQAWLVRKPAV